MIKVWHNKYGTVLYRDTEDLINAIRDEMGSDFIEPLKHEIEENKCEAKHYESEIDDLLHEIDIASMDVRDVKAMLLGDEENKIEKAVKLLDDVIRNLDCVT